MNKIFSIIVTPFALLLLSAVLQLFTSISKADYVAHELPTQKNKQTDLFNESIDDLSDFTNKLEAGKQNGIDSMGGEHGSPQGLQYITKKSKAELSGESAKLESIHENDLAGKGREEMIKSNSLNELYTDYSRPLNKQHLKDAKTIAADQDELLQNLLGELKNLGVDCKTVKGDKKVEPEYFLQTKNTNHKDTIYNQTFCEELRNKYNCRDTVTLKCKKKGMKWNPWEDRTITMVFHEIPSHWWINGRYTSPTYHGRRGHGIDMHSSTINPSYNQEIAAHIANRISALPEQVQVGNQDIVLTALPAPYSRNADFSNCTKRVIFYHIRNAVMTFTYQFRTGDEICEEWSEDWTERCTIK